MAKPRQRIRAADFQPKPKQRFFIHKPETKPVRRTVRTQQNPWHEGMDEAKRSGARLSRGNCLFAARHSTERPFDVCTDHRMRDAERRRQKLDNRLHSLYRKWEADI